MTTKAELETEFADFKKKVVKVALNGANLHGWCDEVYNLLSKDLGLGELLPTRYRVEYNDNGYWDDADEGNFASIREARQVMNREAEYCGGNDAVFLPSLRSDADVDEALARIATFKNRDKRKPEPTYRVVRINDGKVMATK